MLGDCAPSLILIGEGDGRVAYAEGFGEPINYPAVTLLLREMIERLAGDSECRFEADTDDGRMVAVATRLEAVGPGRILGCLFSEGVFPADMSPERVRLQLTGAFAYSALLFKERLDYMEIRSEHLAAEHEMLELSQAEAISCHIDEREKRLREKEEYALKEQFFEAAEEANRSKSEFLANMSHEIRTPMTAILGFTDMLLERLTDPEDLEAAETIHRNGKHLLTIINDILDLSKIEAGKLNMEKVACSVVEIVSDVETLMRPSAEQKSLAFEVGYAGTIPDQVVTDPVRLRQILLNLVGNAIKFTQSGEVRLTVQLVFDEFGLEYLKFDVRDTGIGLSQDKIAQIFEPFMQANSSTTRKYGGSGLGLAISRRLAGMLGGDIDVRSEPGAGSTFTVTVATGDLDFASRIRPAEGLSNRKTIETAVCRPVTLEGKILLVEDGVDNQRLLSLVLEKAGARVQLATNGKEALEAVFPGHAIDGRMESFDLILMDIQMPEMDGYEATRRLRMRGFSGPIIALSAHAHENEIQAIIAAGCDEYLSKPIQREGMLRTIQRYLT